MPRVRFHDEFELRVPGPHGETHAEDRQNDALYCGLFHRGFVVDRMCFRRRINSVVSSTDESFTLLISAKASGKVEADYQPIPTCWQADKVIYIGAAILDDLFVLMVLALVIGSATGRRKGRF
jgi:hypothetical protein